MADAETLDILIRTQVADLGQLEALQAKMAALGAEAKSLNVSSAAGGGFNVTGQVEASSLGAAESQIAALGQAGIAVDGLKVKAQGLHAAEVDLESQANAAARATRAMGIEAGGAIDRLTALGAVAGMGGPLGVGITVALAGLLGYVEVVKSAIQNSDSLAAATQNLGQAYASQGQILEQQGGWIDGFLQKNAKYIDNQYAARDSIAELTRAGLSQSEVQRVMNDAIDLAALKHISLSQAVTTLNDAEHGRMRGLIDLGVTTSKYTDVNGNLIQSQHSVAQSMAEVDRAVHGGRNSLTDLTTTGDELGKTWQDLTEKMGGPFSFVIANDLKALDFLITKIDDVYGAVTKLIPFWDKIFGTGATTSPQISSGWSAGSATVTNGISSFDTAAQQQARMNALDSMNVPNQAPITINNYGVTDPQTTANLTAAQIAASQRP
jgi:hypothetical protein